MTENEKLAAIRKYAEDNYNPNHHVPEGYSPGDGGNFDDAYYEGGYHTEADILKHILSILNS